MRRMTLLILLLNLMAGCDNKTNESGTMNLQMDFEKYDKINKERDTLNLEILVKQFKDKETPFRQNALTKINKRKYNRITELLESALHDEDEQIRILAIQTIKSNMQVESLDKLMSIFKDSNNHTIIANITKTFVHFDKTEPIPLIIEKLESSNNMIVYDCVWTLGEIGTKHEIKVLEAMTLNTTIPKIYDDQGILSQYSIYTIGEIAEKSIESIRKKASS